MTVSPEEIASVCGRPSQTGAGWKCCCPAHDDRDPSLAIVERDGKLLFKCFAGCSYESIVEALRSRGINLSNGHKPTAQTTVHYTYNSAAGVPMFRKCKVLPDKKFFIERYVNGAWVSGLGDTPRVLYRLSELRAAQVQGLTVAIAEGEKDCDRVKRELGIVCTCNVGGAQQWLPEYTEEFRGAVVEIFYDQDEPGRKRRDMLISSLKGVAKSVSVYNLPPKYKDVSDYFDDGQKASDLLQYKELVTSEGLTSTLLINAGAWLEESRYQIEPMVSDLFDCGDKVAIIGKSKSRKSFFALQLLLSVVTGKSFLGFDIPEPRKALLIQFEIKEAHFWHRLSRMANAMGVSPGELKSRLTIVNARGRKFSQDETLGWVQSSGAELVLFDPLYKMMEAGENAAEEMKPILAWFDTISKTTGATVAYVHHDKKGFVAEQDATDRGAGSGVMGRDFDAALLLTPHKDESLTGLETIARNYAPREGRSICWMDGCFVESDVPMQVKTSRNAAIDKNRTAMCDWEEPVKKLLEGSEGLPMAQLIQGVRDLGASRDMARAVIDSLIHEGKAQVEYKRAERGMPAKIVRLLGGAGNLLSIPAI